MSEYVHSFDEPTIWQPAALPSDMVPEVHDLLPGHLLPTAVLNVSTMDNDRPFEGLPPAEIRARLADAYGLYQPYVAQLRAEVAELELPEQHPQHVGSGCSAHVYALEVNDEAVAVRLTRAHSQAVVGMYVAGFAAAPYLPRHEEFLAMTDERHHEYATVSKLTRGTNLIRAGAEAMRSMTYRNLNDLADALVAGNNAGVDRDRGPGNYIFHPLDGFGIVDYTFSQPPPNMAEDFLGISSALSGHTIPIGVRTRRPDFYRARSIASLAVVDMWRTICTQRFSGMEREWLLLQVDTDKQWLRKQLALRP